MICSGVSSQKITGICRFVKNSLRVAGSVGSRITDKFTNKYNYESYRGIRHFGGIIGGFYSHEQEGVASVDYGEPSFYYDPHIGSRNSRTIMLISTIWIHITE